MNTNIEDYKLISGIEYMALVNPQFEGQTRVDSDGMYYMFWESEGILYKTYQHI